jgi:amino acid adenylation domain-containing protein
MSDLAKENVQDVYPLSPVQEGMLFHSLLMPEAPPYQEQLVHTLEGEADPGVLERAWHHLIDRHPVLRTVFYQGRKQPMQIVLKKRQVPLAVCDLRGLAGEAQKIALSGVLEAEFRRVLPLDRGPLMRLLLAPLAAGRAKLACTFNHIILDGWSSHLLLEDLLGIHAALMEDRPLPPAGFPLYRSYITWLARQDREEARRFWSHRLAGFMAPTPLPADRTAAEGPRRLARCRTACSRETTQALQVMAQRLRVTPGTVARGAWALLLARASGEPEVVFGFTVSGRPPDLPGVERIVGPLINTLPVRARIGEETPLAELLYALQQQYVNASHYGYLPLAEVQAASEIAPPRKLFESLIDFLSQPGVDGLASPWLRLVPGEDREGHGGTSFDLAADVWLGDRLVAELFYTRERFDHASAERLLGCFRRLIEGMAARPEARLGELDLLSPEERRHLIADLNRTPSPRPLDRLPHRIFADRAAGIPDAIAAVCGSAHVTYATLDRWANRIARWLLARGARRGDLAGVFGDRGPDLLAALLGIYKAGAAYLPLDPDYPDGRIAGILRDSDARFLITEAGLAARALVLAGRLPGEKPVLCWDVAPSDLAVDGRSDLLRLPAGSPGCPVEGNDLANVFYTSGSTGSPKGAMVEHAGVLNHLWAKIGDLDIGPDSAVAQTASQGFDISVWQMLAPLLVGGRVVVYGEPEASDVVGLLGRVERDGVTVLETVPSLLEAMLSELPDRGGPRLPCLEYLISNAETLPLPVARRWLERFPHVALVNTYGATECSDDVTHQVFRTSSELGQTRVGVGRPIAGMQVLVLDPGLRPVPVGWPGQIAFSGVGLGRGYLGDAGKTAQTFVPDPWSEESGGRLYLTGDQGRWSRGGHLEFLGRLDRQVKVRGHRIEPAEVEAVLGRLPGVRQAVVEARPDRQGRLRLLAWVVADRPWEGGQLRERLREWLPPALLPEQIVPLAALPLNRNGKVDRAALPVPEPRERTGAWEPPRDEVEEEIAAIWREVLEVDQVGVRDDFFALGGHSLKTVQVRSRLKHHLGIELPLRALFDHPTVAELAQAVRLLLNGRGAERREPIPRLPDADFYPLSHAQRRLWFLHRLDPKSLSYNLASLYEIRGQLDLTTFRHALAILADRHASLRTCFQMVNGEPRQRIVPGFVLPLDFDDLCGLTEEEAEFRQSALLRRDLATPYDLESPPVRLRLIRRREDRHLLFLGLHHIVTDAWSWGLLARDLEAIWSDLARGGPGVLPPLPVRYVDYAIWHNERLRDERIEEPLRRYWLERLGGQPPILELPADRPPTERSAAAGEIRFALSPKTSSRLHVLAQEGRSTLPIALLAAVQTFLFRITGQEDVALGMPVTARNHVDVEGVVGFFVNLIVLRTSLAGDPTFRELLERARDVALGGYAHQDYPFDLLVERLNPGRDRGRRPLFSVLFAVEEGFSAGGEERWIAELPAPVDVAFSRPATDLDLEITFYKTGEDLAGSILYDSKRFEEATARRLVACFERLLESAAAAPESQLSALELLDAAALHQVIVELNDTARAYPSGSIYEQFVIWAERAPERTAVTFHARRASYGELAVRADRLARKLRALGVGPGRPVGVMAGRSPELVAAALGVLAAGGIYLPLDPAYPASRLAAMLRDSGAPVLLLEHGFEPPAGLDPLTAILVLDPSWSAFANPPVDLPRPTVGDADPAYLIYTSGSTGEPKGVAVSHRAFVAYVHATTEAHGLSERDIFAQKTSPSFDVSAWEIFTPLLLGATVSIVPDEAVLDGRQLIRYLAAEGVTVLDVTPGLLGILEDALAELRPDARRLSLRLLRVGGEPVPASAVIRWLHLLPEVPLFDCYGPTEATIDATLGRIAEPPEEGSGTVPVGRPVANGSVYVLDGARRPVPIGVPGEVHLAGAGLAEGYWRSPEATDRAFPTFELPAVGPRRLYRTGDRGRWRPDGRLELLGRLDHQVKVRGYRIELGEIEAALLRHGGVCAGAAAVCNVDGEPRLVAYTVEERLVGTQELRTFLRRILPGWMIPELFVRLEELPRLPNGKLDRVALPAPEGVRPGLDIARAAPRDETERAMAEVWEEVLQVHGIGIFDDFFALGGQSLKAVDLAGRIERRFGIELPLRELFRAPTVAGLSDWVRRQRDSAGAKPVSSSLVPLQAGSSYLPPLFLVHPHSGEVFVYRDLAGALGPARPVYGLRSRGLEPGEEPLDGLEEMARYYVEEIRRVQGSGPYHLGGWSYGGIVAFEIARQLEAAGERVALLALLDAAPAGGDEARDFDEAGFGLPRIAQLFFDLDAADFSGLDEPASLRLILRRANGNELVRQAGSPTRLAQLAAVLRASTLALSRYRPAGPVQTDIDLLQASGESHVPDPDLWRRLTEGEVLVTPIPSGHHDLLAPENVTHVAGALRDALQRTAMGRQPGAAEGQPIRRG